MPSSVDKEYSKFKNVGHSGRDKVLSSSPNVTVYYTITKYLIVNKNIIEVFSQGHKTNKSLVF